MRRPSLPAWNANSLQDFFEGLMDRLRRPRQPFSDEIIPVQVDLVGDYSPPKALPPEPANPFSAGAQPPIAGAGAALSTDWSFRETVVLRPQRRGSRVLLYVALAMTGAGLTWLVVAPLNQTVLVQGKLEPSNKVKLVQTPVSGLIDQVLIQEGETVKAGQVLLRFDLKDPRNQLASAESIKRQLEEENATYAAALGDKMALSQLSPNQRQRLSSQSEELRNRREAALQQLRRSEQRARGLRVSVATADNIADRYEKLLKSGAISEVQVLETRTRADELSSQLAEEEHEILRLKAELRSTASGPSAEFRGRIEANRRLIAEQDARISSAKQQLRYSELKAPASGVVLDLDARPGFVAQASQPLLRVVPQGALQAKVYIPSNVIGFIKPGQDADISLDTFPSEDYGRLPAVIQRVGTDALTPEDQKESLGTDASGLYYPAVLDLSRQDLKAGSKSIPLQPGMSLSADIQLRQRRMINVITGFFEDKLRSLERIR